MNGTIMNNKRLVRIPILLVGSFAASLSLIPACAEDRAGGTDSNTHWLDPCERDDQCGGLACICGICSEACDDDAGCNAPGTSCVSRTACSSGSDGQSCLADCADDTDCNALSEGLRCERSSCVRPGPTGSGDVDQKDAACAVAAGQEECLALPDCQPIFGFNLQVERVYAGCRSIERGCGALVSCARTQGAPELCLRFGDTCWPRDWTAAECGADQCLGPLGIDECPRTDGACPDDCTEVWAEPIDEDRACTEDRRLVACSQSSGDSPPSVFCGLQISTGVRFQFPTSHPGLDRFADFRLCTDEEEQGFLVSPCD